MSHARWHRGHSHFYGTFIGVGGDTKLTAGPLHLFSGPVDAITNTVHWKAPSVTFATPDFQIVGAKSIRRTGHLAEFVAEFNEVTGKHVQIVDSTSKIVGAEHKVVGIEHKTFGFQTSVGAAKVDLCGIKLVNKGVHVSKKATGVENAGFQAYLAGLTTFG
ncbi:MAG: hypothetical protein WKG00_38235 [Polyangiaceae bacterium]